VIEPFERRRILFDGEINQPDKVASECICLGLGIKRTKAGERFGAFASLQKANRPMDVRVNRHIQQRLPCWGVLPSRIRSRGGAEFRRRYQALNGLARG